MPSYTHVVILLYKNTESYKNISIHMSMIAPPLQQQSSFLFDLARSMFLPQNLSRNHM